MEDAPLHNALAEGPEGGRAYWLKASDGVRIRVAVWPGGEKGTVLLLPGRTEYIEKYGRAATDLAARGYTIVTVDWRGQGLADRLIDDPMIGHVEDFQHYQDDLDTVLAFIRKQGLPTPLYMIAHSMGGAIGLRGLHNFSNAFAAAAFSGPMWGISIAPALKPVARALPPLARLAGLDHKRVPGSSPNAYVRNEPFDDNMLTTDPEMWRYMLKHSEQIDGIDLFGPSMRWLQEAIAETADLRRKGPAAHPAVTFVGGNERIIDTDPVHQLMGRWKNGKLIITDGAEHEIMMETPPRRKLFFDEADALFGKH